MNILFPPVHKHICIPMDDKGVIRTSYNGSTISLSSAMPDVLKVHNRRMKPAVVVVVDAERERRWSARKMKKMIEIPMHGGL